MVFKRRDKPPLPERLRELLAPRRGWRRTLEYLGYRIKRLPDTPHRVALGFSCGVFVSFTPLFGLHLVLAPILARVIGGNALAGLLGTFAGNPLTFPVIASVSLGLGRRILGHGVTGRDFSRIVDAFWQFVAGLGPSLLSLIGLGRPEWARLSVFVNDVFLPYLVGGILPGLVAAVASYYVIRPLIGAYQARRHNRAIARAHTRLGQTADGAPASGYRTENPGAGGPTRTP